MTDIKLPEWMDQDGPTPWGVTEALREVGRMAVNTLVRQNVFVAWLDGDVTAYEALRSLCDDYEEIDLSYKQFEGMRDQTRKQIEQVVDHMGGKAEVKGFGMLFVSGPSTVTSYSKEQIVALISALVDEGNLDIAARLAACEKQTDRKGSLRIEREKGR